MWKFLSQGWNPCHGSDPSCFSDNARSLTCCTTRELHNCPPFQDEELRLGFNTWWDLDLSLNPISLQRLCVWTNITSSLVHGQALHCVLSTVSLTWPTNNPSILLTPVLQVRKQARKVSNMLTVAPVAPTVPSLWSYSRLHATLKAFFSCDEHWSHYSPQDQYMIFLFLFIHFFYFIP